ncbi:MAG: molybdopterin molybdotransferase MoeA [Acidimicrobiales bacterium]
MIGAGEARSVVLAPLHPLAPVERALAETIGLVTASTVHATEPAPFFTNSAMDGFAVRGDDVTTNPMRLRIVDSVFAGESSEVVVGLGEAIRIMTGAPLPPGADTVCPREDTVVDEDGRFVTLQRAVVPGDCVRHVGEDLTVGDTLVSPGDVVDPALLGTLAAQGITSLIVHPVPRVGVLSTGNELVEGPCRLGPGQIRDSNRPMLLAALRQSGFVPIDLGTVRDSKRDLRAAFEHARTTCDAVISTGGVSAGDADFVKVVLAELFVERAQSMQVAIRPGKPFTFAYDESTNTPFFGLAGNPVSTLVGFELFVRPALRRLAGHQDLERPSLSMVLDDDLVRRPDGKLHLVHGVCRIHEDGLVHVERLARRGSHLLFAVAGANCLIETPDGEGYRAGDTVRALLLDPSGLNVVAQNSRRP